MPNIDRDSPIPVYYQVKLDINRRIERQEWIETKKLPSEKELALYYKVSRVTIRQSLAELEKDGIISRYQGKGAFINKIPTPFFYDLNYVLVKGKSMLQRGLSIEASVLSFELISDPFPIIADELNLTNGQAAIYLKRLFRLDGRAIAVGRSWLNHAIVPNFQTKPLINNSLSKSLQHYYDAKATRVDDTLEVIRASLPDSKLLDIANEAPLLLIKGKSYLPDDSPLEYSETSWAGDIVRFHLSFKLTHDGQRLPHST